MAWNIERYRTHLKILKPAPSWSSPDFIRRSSGEHRVYHKDPSSMIILWHNTPRRASNGSLPQETRRCSKSCSLNTGTTLKVVHSPDFDHGQTSYIYIYVVTLYYFFFNAMCIFIPDGGNGWDRIEHLVFMGSSKSGRTTAFRGSTGTTCWINGAK